MEQITIQTAEDFKTLYLQTDITNVAAVQSALSIVSGNKNISGHEAYLVALNHANPANLAKAQKYHRLQQSPLKKNLGWILMVVFGVLMAVIDPSFEDTLTSILSLGFWVGVGIQVYISTLKGMWNRLTLSGAVIHPALSNNTTNT